MWVYTHVCVHVPCSTCIQYLERLEENFGCELKLWAAVSHRCEYWVPNVGSLELASIPNYWGILPSLLCTLTFTFGVTALGYTYTLLVYFTWAKRFQCGTLRRMDLSTVSGSLWWVLTFTVRLSCVPFFLCSGDVRQWEVPATHIPSPGSSFLSWCVGYNRLNSSKFKLK